MLSRLLARASLTVATLAIMFANYWYTFGLWPKSWLSFVLCGCGSIVVIALQMTLDKESKTS